MLEHVITFTLLKRKISIECKDIHIPGFNLFLNKINRNRYNDYIFTEQSFKDESKYKIGSDMKLTCDNLFQRQH